MLRSRGGTIHNGAARDELTTGGPFAIRFRPMLDLVCEDRSIDRQSVTPSQPVCVPRLTPQGMDGDVLANFKTVDLWEVAIVATRDRAIDQAVNQSTSQSPTADSPCTSRATTRREGRLQATRTP